MDWISSMCYLYTNFLVYTPFRSLMYIHIWEGVTPTFPLECGRTDYTLSRQTICEDSGKAETPSTVWMEIIQSKVRRLYKDSKRRNESILGQFPSPDRKSENQGREVSHGISTTVCPLQLFRTNPTDSTADVKFFSVTTLAIKVPRLLCR